MEFKTLTNKYDDGVFNVDEKHGFLPKFEPLEKLPSKYYQLQEIIDNMPIYIGKDKKDHGYLYHEGLIHKKIDELTNYTMLVYKEEKPIILQSLFRAYTFIASAYLLEPSHQHYQKTKEYGRAVSELPENIALPLSIVSEKLDVFPYLDYHYSYSLCNYVKKDKSKGFHWSNLDMACKFSGTQDEIGFIMLHVDINSYSNKLIKSIKHTYDSIKKNNIEYFLNGLEMNHLTMSIINSRRREMWNASNHKNYNDFRVFIMGIKGNEEIFGDGVKYIGTLDESPRQYRGQSGSQDNIIPTEDIFTGLINYYPENKLTEYLLDMRQYRPKVIQNFLNDLYEDRNYIDTFIDTLDDENKKIALIHILLSVYQIFLFRNGHWMFVQKYIMANTKYPKATGGTPIISWIPNQIEACLKYMDVLFKKIDKIEDDLFNSESSSSSFKETYEKYDDTKSKFEAHVNVFNRQMEELKNINYDVEMIYLVNGKFKEF